MIFDELRPYADDIRARRPRELVAQVLERRAAGAPCGLPRRTRRAHLANSIQQPPRLAAEAPGAPRRDLRRIRRLPAPHRRRSGSSGAGPLG